MSTKNINWILIGVGSITAIGIGIGVFFSWKYRNKIKSTISDVSDYIFSNDVESELKKLHPKAQPIFRSFLSDIEKMGYKVRVTSGYRTFQEQIGLKKENPKNATAGYSMHNYGMALDINVNYGNLWFHKSSPKADWEKTGIPQHAKNKYNMRWGGDFNGYPDNVHFDLGNTYNVNKLYAQAIKQFGSAENAKGNEVNIT